jgi:hypothetical protein
MYIDAGKVFNVVSFFSSLIDDIRIYDVAMIAEKVEVIAQ